MLNPFSPPNAACSEDPVSLAERMRAAASWLLSAAAGALLGYLLFNPLFRLPFEFVVAVLKPVLQAASRAIGSPALLHLVELVTVMFAANLPNTIFVSALTAAALRFRRYRRHILYSSLAWPLFLYMAQWLHVAVLKLGLARAGRPADTDGLLSATGFDQLSVLILVTEIVFLLTVFTLDRWLDRKHPPSPREHQS